MTEAQNTELAVLPLRDIVVFPHMIVPLFVGRDKSVKALDAAMKDKKQIMLLTQRDAVQDDPSTDDLYEIGTVANVLQLLKLPDGTVKVLVEGVRRIRVTEFLDADGYFAANYEDVVEEGGDVDNIHGTGRAVLTQFEQYVKLNKKIPPEVVSSLGQIEDISKLTDTIASHLTLKIADKQKLLEENNLLDRIEHIFAFMEGEIGVLEVEKKIRSRVKNQMEKTQREYYLNEQMKAIQKELDEGEEGVDELTEYEEKIDGLKMSKDAKARAKSELKKLKQMSPMSAEATVVRNYLDCMTNIPWNVNSRIKKDLKLAQKVLDQDHYGLEKVKERILEFLAVQQRMNKIKGPILCLVGPPGVGKTSLGKSIARSTNRNFVRISLGGVSDESEIRGHRRTYIGAMPGKIIQSMKKAKSSNPLFLMDEIDKLGHDWRGDPSSALLEVLDPEQNSTFNDHYLELDYDLSKVMFICTANTLDLPRPLLDRMEVIRLSGYTEDEKVEICKRHLISKAVKNNGLKKGEFSLTDPGLRDLIRYYTREAGVRNLEREISNLARKAVKEITMTSKKSVKITPRNLDKYAGVRRFNFGMVEEEDRVGLVNGLAWTETGGDLLSIEAVTIEEGKGKVSYTGNLKEVMQESIKVAEMLIKSQARLLGVDADAFNDKDLHIHVPEGATPKDGPSAGITMVTAMVSALTKNPVRKNVAMTGEVDLLGQVLPIGGLKEKLLAALRGGITTALIPKENEKDLVEIPANVKKGIEIIPVSTIEEVLIHALALPIDGIMSSESVKVEQVSQKTAENKEKDVIRH